MTSDQIIQKLKNKIYQPVYFLAGAEPYFIDEISDFIQHHVLNDSEKDFNQVVLYARDTDINTLIMQARKYPMMANHQVVIVKEAQDLKDLDKLALYVQAPLKSTILVINYKYKDLDKRTKLYKLLNEKDYYIEFKKLYDNQVPVWINQFLKTTGYTIDLNAATLLTEFLGTDLGKIVNEIEKLMIAMPKTTKQITSALIEKYIGISKDYTVFELQKAIVQKNALKCFRIADHFAQNEKEYPLPGTIALLYSFFSKILVYHYIKDKSERNVASVLKISPFFVKDYEQAARRFNKDMLERIISYLRECDMRSKGFNNASVPGGEILKEFLALLVN